MYYEHPGDYQKKWDFFSAERIPTESVAAMDSTRSEISAGTFSTGDLVEFMPERLSAVPEAPGGERGNTFPYSGP